MRATGPPRPTAVRLRRRACPLPIPPATREPKRLVRTNRAPRPADPASARTALRAARKNGRSWLWRDRQAPLAPTTDMAAPSSRSRRADGRRPLPVAALVVPNDPRAKRFLGRFPAPSGRVVRVSHRPLSMSTAPPGATARTAAHHASESPEQSSGCNRVQLR